MENIQEMITTVNKAIENIKMLKAEVGRLKAEKAELVKACKSAGDTIARLAEDAEDRQHAKKLWDLALQKVQP